MISDYSTREKTVKTRFIPNGVYIGVVKRVDPVLFKVWVEIPRIAPGADYGPLMVASDSLPAVRDQVACMFLENRADDIIVLGVIRSEPGGSNGSQLIYSGLSGDKPLTGALEGTVYYETDNDVYMTWNGLTWSPMTSDFSLMSSSREAAIISMEVGS